MNVEQTYISLPAFDTTNVSTMKPANMSKSLLAEARSFSTHSKRKTEGF